MRRKLVDVVRGLVALPFVALVLLLFLGPPTLEGGAFGIALLVGAFAFVVRRKRLGALAAAVMVALVVARLVSAGGGARLVQRDGRWMDRVLPERDVALGASRMLELAGVIDEPGLLPALRGGYDRMRADEGWVPSPVLSTLVRGHARDDFVTLELPGRRTDAAVVFLHGSMGNVTVECWQVAQAARAHELATHCPSTDTSGRWDRPRGVAILGEVLERLRKRGVRRVVLVGLSAGGIGLSRLAPRLRMPEGLTLEGLVHVSGTAAPTRPRRVPTLILQGARDTMTPPAPARRHARALGPRARYVELADASHWLVLSHHERVVAELGSFFDETLRP